MSGESLLLNSSSSNGNYRPAVNLTEGMLCVAGLGPVLVPLSSVIAGASGVLPPHITAALQSLGPGGSAAPHFANTVPSAPVLPAPSAGQLLQQAAVNQILQQQAAAAFAPNPSSAQARPTAASTAGRGRLDGGYPGVGPTSLAALVPHVPSPPHVAGSLAAAVAAAAAAAKTEAPAASAGSTYNANSCQNAN